MLMIPVNKITREDGSIMNVPATDIPDDAVKVTCDGTNYAIYVASDNIQPTATSPFAPPIPDNN